MQEVCCRIDDLFLAYQIYLICHWNEYTVNSNKGIIYVYNYNFL
jgi:hypothetical protein